MSKSSVDGYPRYCEELMDKLDAAAERVQEFASRAAVTTENRKRSRDVLIKRQENLG
jgi:hypothetical protein